MAVGRVNGVAAVSLVVLMVLGSLTLWLAVPVAWLWLASHIDESLDASLKAYGAIAVGVPITMLALFWVLRRLDLAHQRIIGSEHDRRLAPARRRAVTISVGKPAWARYSRRTSSNPSSPNTGAASTPRQLAVTLIPRA